MAVQRLYFTPEMVERALIELGPTGTHGEAIIKAAALAAVHVMRGGSIQIVASPHPSWQTDAEGYVTEPLVNEGVPHG